MFLPHATVLFGNGRHIPTAIKELTVTLQTAKRMKKAKIATLLDVHPRTVRHVTKLETKTGSVV
jgi:hypothetical protein